MTFKRNSISAPSRINKNAQSVVFIRNKITAAVGGKPLTSPPSVFMHCNKIFYHNMQTPQGHNSALEYEKAVKSYVMIGPQRNQPHGRG